MVDTQFADTAKACLDGLKQKTGDRPLDAVFNTHHHGDHTGGNAVFRAEAKKLIAHANVPELQRRSPRRRRTPPRRPSPTRRSTRPGPRSSATKRSPRSYNGPGHTGGDAIIHFERAHVVHMGDLLFHERHPRVDRAGGASIQNWIVILEKVAKDMPG